MNVVEEAIIFATQAHQGQMRKFGNIPYILHPVEVASIIATLTDDQEVIAAGALHDTIEDCGVTAKELSDRFGTRVSALVQSESEDRFSDKPPAETWKERKEDSLLMLAMTPRREVKLLWLGDKLSNMRSFHREFMVKGHDLWQILHQKDPAMQAWYYRTIAENLTELKDTQAYQEYKYLVDTVFKDV